jgi:hypothetical protein
MAGHSWPRTAFPVLRWQISPAAAAAVCGARRRPCEGGPIDLIGRENDEDYSAEFLVMLNTWDAAVGFLLPQLLPQGGNAPPMLEIARFLGWTLVRSRRL